MSPLNHDRIIISQTLGPGLGDNLLCSTLPERFAALGKEVFISSKNPVHNQNIHDLVWGCNPYVKGVVDEEPNAGLCFGWPENVLRRRDNYVYFIEAANDLEPINRVPKIYYKPNIIPELSDKIILDLNSRTIVDFQKDLPTFLSTLFPAYGYDFKSALQVGFEPTAKITNISKVSGVDTILLQGLYHYCDVLYSCRAFFTVLSGAHVLATAIRSDRPTPNINCLISKHDFNQRLITFPGVEYFVA